MNPVLPLFNVSDEEYDAALLACHERILYPVVRVRSDRAGGSGTVIYSQPDPHCPEEYLSFILTCHHVIEDAIKLEKDWFDPVLKKRHDREVLAQVDVEVFNYAYRSSVDSGATYRADIVAYSAEHDLTVLKLDSPTRLPFVAALYPKGRERRVYAFEPVWSSGCSLGHDPICHPGAITYKEELIANKKLWMTCSAVIFGNSGGAIFHGRTLDLLGVPARVSVSQYGFGLDINVFMNWCVPIFRIYEFLDENCLEFIYDATKDYYACLEALKQKQEEALKDLK